MAITREQAVAATGTTGATAALSAPTAGRLIVAFATADVADAAISIAGLTILDHVTATGNTGLIGAAKISDGTETSIVATATAATVCQLHVFVYAGLDAVNPYDQIAHASTGSSVTTQTSGTTPITRDPNELCVAGFAFNGSISAPNFTNSFAGLLTNTRLVTAELVVASQALYETTCTWTTGRRSDGMMLTFATTPPSSGFSGWGIPI